MDSPWILIVTATVLALVATAVAIVVRRRRRGAPAVPPPEEPTGTGLRLGLQTTRRRLLGQVDSVLRRARGDLGRALPELEEALIAADVGVRAAAELVARVRERVEHGAEDRVIRRVLRQEIADVLAANPAPAPTARPWVILVLGVNGVGKTTTIGKLAAVHAANGRRVLLVAADTFRAAASEQLGVWAQRTGAELVRQAPGANPGAVVFDGMRAALARGADVVLVDTAGRLHTRVNLVEELRKIRRIITRECPGAPHETLLVLDATTGQNAVAQARTFSEALDVTGVVLTKLDGTARGGVVIAVRREIGVPIRYIGIGEGIDDLRPFDPQQFAEALCEEEPATASGGPSFS